MINDFPNIEIMLNDQLITSVPPEHLTSLTQTEISEVGYSVDMSFVQGRDRALLNRIFKAAGETRKDGQVRSTTFTYRISYPRLQKYSCWYDFFLTRYEESLGVSVDVTISGKTKGIKEDLKRTPGYYKGKTSQVASHIIEDLNLFPIVEETVDEDRQIEDELWAQEYEQSQGIYPYGATANDILESRFRRYIDDDSIIVKGTGSAFEVLRSLAKTARSKRTGIVGYIFDIYPMCTLNSVGVCFFGTPSFIAKEICKRKLNPPDEGVHAGVNRIFKMWATESGSLAYESDDVLDFKPSLTAESAGAALLSGLYVHSENTKDGVTLSEVTMPSLFKAGEAEFEFTTAPSWDDIDKFKLTSVILEPRKSEKAKAEFDALYSSLFVSTESASLTLEFNDHTMDVGSNDYIQMEVYEEDGQFHWSSGIWRVIEASKQLGESNTIELQLVRGGSALGTYKTNTLTL